MKRILIICLTILISHCAWSQYKGGRGIPVSISVSRVVGYHIQNVDLERNVENSCTVYQLINENQAKTIVCDGESMDSRYEVNGQYLRFVEQSNGLNFGVQAQIFPMFGAGLGYQYNFKSRDRMKLYLEAFLTFSEKRGSFNLSPSMQIGAKKFYTGAYSENIFYFGPALDLDIRICRESTFYFNMRVGIDYYWNNENFQIEDASEEPPVMYYTNPRNENIVAYGSLGLKYRFERR